MDDAPIVRFVAQREAHTDCTIAAFAMCVGVSYEEALVAIAAVVPRVLVQGATWRQLVRAARTLKVTLVQKTTGFDSTTWPAGGILGIKRHSGEEHAVYFARGLIVDGQSESVWDADVYLRVHRATVQTMLVRVK